MGIYERFGVKPVINASGYVTRMSGSIMLPVVVEAMVKASREFVSMAELEQAASAVIARHTGAEAGYVTSGAAAGLTLAAAACLTGLDRERMNRLPDTSRMPDQIVIPGTHRDSYDRCLRSAGARLRIAGSLGRCTPDDLALAIGGDTVAVAFFSAHESDELSLEDVVAIAHINDVPLIVDAAIALPPPENLRRFTESGADLVVFSAGKALRGPQTAGFVAGRADLIESIALQHQDLAAYAGYWDLSTDYGSPGHGIGRGMKAGKEEIIGTLVALEAFIDRDLDRERALQEHGMRLVADTIREIPGLDVETGYHQTPGFFVQARVDPTVIGMTAVDIAERLMADEPRVAVAVGMFGDIDHLRVGFATLGEGEAEIVAERLWEVLRRPEDKGARSYACRERTESTRTCKSTGHA